MNDKRILSHAKPTPGEHTAPSNLDEYAEWFNRTFTFARAEVVTPQTGRRFIDVRYR